MGALVDAAAHEDETVHPPLMQKAQGRLEFIGLLVNKLGEEGGLAVLGLLEDALGQGVQEGVLMAADDDGHQVALGLLEAAGVGIAHKMARGHDALHLLPGFAVHVRAVVQHAGHGGHADAGLLGDVLDGVDLHAHEPPQHGRQACRSDHR